MIHELPGSEHFRFGSIGERAVSKSDNRIYYERRWVQATEMGDWATDPKIAAIHYELGARYAILSAANEIRPNVVAIRKGRRADPPSTRLFGLRAEPLLKQALESA